MGNQEKDERSLTAEKSGRPDKPKLSLVRKQTIRELWQEGKNISQIAEQCEVSEEEISEVLRENPSGECGNRGKVLLYFMNEEELCTKIYADFTNRRVRIENVTDDVWHQAFGVRQHPTWEDFQQFLEDRCFPRTRDKMKLILDNIGVQCYDPWQIILKTQGRMAEDNQWLRIVEENDDKVK